VTPGTRRLLVQVLLPSLTSSPKGIENYVQLKKYKIRQKGLEMQARSKRPAIAGSRKKAKRIILAPTIEQRKVSDEEKEEGDGGEKVYARHEDDHAVEARRA